MHLDEGMTRFKCATIAEAEMAAGAGAPDVLLAYQPVGPNVARLVRLVQTFPATRFAAIVDDRGAIDALSAAAVAGGVVLDLFLDLDGGMHRSGIAPGAGAVELYRWLSTRPGLRAAGLHMYDGHVKATDRGRAPAGVRRRLRARRDDAAGDRGGGARRCRPSSSAARRPFRSTHGAPASSAARGRRSSGTPATPRRCRICRSCRRPCCSRG